MGRIIALLTDFGTTDTYVGVMKGVMLAICPDVQFVDLTHEIQPQNIKQAAFALLNSYRYFPAGTIFLVVVDPGVGSSRKPIAVQAGNYSFVAPDNGVLSYVLRELGGGQVVELNNPQSHLPATSATFHGRDIFAPAAALLASGTALEQLGSQGGEPVELADPTLVIETGQITGEVLHIDHFGSAVTSIGLLTWGASGQLTLMPRIGISAPQVFRPEHVDVTVGNKKLSHMRRTYAEVGQGEALALVGSSGYLELSINGGSFAERFGVKIGDTVELQIG